MTEVAVELAEVAVELAEVAVELAEVAVELTGDTGRQKLFPIPKDNAGVMRPYSYQRLPLASFSITQRM